MEIPNIRLNQRQKLETPEVKSRNVIDEIPNNEIPTTVVRDIPPPVVAPAILPPPVARQLEVPVIDLPNPIIDYPTLDVPTQEEFEASLDKGNDGAEEGIQDIRELPDTSAGIPVNVGGIEVTLPDPSVLATAGAVAVITTASAMVATQVLNQAKSAAEPLIRELTKKRKKVKIKQVKPVLHYVKAENGVDIFEYSGEGTKLIAQTDNVEQYVRDQIEIDLYYEMDNKIIIDDNIKTQFTKEGQKRFKKLFAPAKVIAKKLASKFAF